MSSGDSGSIANAIFTQRNAFSYTNDCMYEFFKLRTILMRICSGSTSSKNSGLNSSSPPKFASRTSCKSSISNKRPS